ncbi:hypothetical protein Tco_1011765, partial [Tanacetum coccineum]
YFNKDQELVDEYSKPLPLVGPQFGQRVLVERFFNNDLQYLMKGNKEKKYALLITNHPVAEYNIRWIEEEIRRLFRKNIIEYDENDALDIRIKSMKESLNLNDIEDLYVLKAQGKLHHLGGPTEYDLANSLLIYIRSKLIKKRVEDVQLGVESY